MPFKLMKHQQQALQRVQKGALLLAADPGTGKTLVAIALQLQTGKHLTVIAPKFLLQNWRSEFEKWNVSHGNVTFLSHYEVRKGKLPLKPESILCIDESHFGFANTKSKVFKALQTWATKFPPAYTLLLSGTPITSKPSNIFGQLVILGYEDQTNVFAFQDRYCQMEPAYRGASVMREAGVKDVKGFERLLDKWVMRVRLKEVLELPPLTRQTIDLQLKEDKILKEISKCLSAEELNRAISDNARGIETKRTVAIAKSHAIVKGQVLEPLGSRPTLVFSDHPDSLEILHKGCQGVEFGVVNAKTKAEDRVAIVNAFQKGELDRLYINIRCGGVGLNAQRAEYVVFADLAYTPASNEQALARAYRKGRDKPLIVWDIVSGGHDKHLSEIVLAKENFML